ncbi:MAG: hypothetical protein C5B52_14005 [Bacteroidetes bacterium]|nr:MAG: hypothetical protein C5B52_14005 [Bacteroidota bacterium]
MSLIPAIKKDEALINEVQEFSTDHNNFHLWWLGQSGYLLLWNGKKILIDPYLSDSLTKKYAVSDKPHTRMSERVVAPELFFDITAVSSSHNHTDHLDAETLIPIIQNNPKIRFIIPEANRTFVADRVKIPVDFAVGLNDNSSYSFEGFTFHGVPAAHNSIERDEKNNCRFMGYIIEFGRWKIYHSGDTLWFDGMEEILRPFQVDLALLPINGNEPSRGVAGNLDCREAARLAKEIHAGLVIPCHYDMFTFNTADPYIFAQIADRIQQPYKILKPGEHWSSEELKS